MSVPPVVAPWENTMPSPRPISAPPQREASMGSMAENPPIRVKTSMAAEVTNMENRDDASRWNPSSFQPTRKMGTFSTKTITPTEIWGRNTLMTCPRPVMPAIPT